MLSIASAAREIISRRPFIEDALSQGIINYNTLASQIQPEIERLIGLKQTKISSISMALRRIGDQYKIKITDTINQKLTDFVGSDTSLKYDLFEITYQITSGMNLSDRISKLYNDLTVDPSDFLSITKGRTELTIITNTRNKSSVSEAFKDIKIKNMTSNLAALTITIPDDSLKIPGLFYYFTKALTLEGLSIVELISTFTEMQFILEEEYISDASRIIRGLLKNAEPVLSS